MGYRVRIDPNLCIGSSQCAEVAPDVFAMNDTHTLALCRDATADLARILEGAQACPVDAIVVVDEATGKQVHP